MQATFFVVAKTIVSFTLATNSQKMLKQKVLFCDPNSNFRFKHSTLNKTINKQIVFSKQNLNHLNLLTFNRYARFGCKIYIHIYFFIVSFYSKLY